jgi:hypothetical protein
MKARSASTWVVQILSELIGVIAFLGCHGLYEVIGPHKRSSRFGSVMLLRSLVLNELIDFGALEDTFSCLLDANPNTASSISKSHDMFVALAGSCNSKRKSDNVAAPTLSTSGGAHFCPRKRDRFDTSDEASLYGLPSSISHSCRWQVAYSGYNRYDIAQEP